jgi:hypothetical protein
LFTGVPEPSSDRVVGLGVGVRGAVFFNGARSDPLFAYTPNWARLPVAAFATAAEAREFAAKLDVPYALRLRWRRKGDLKIGDIPATRYLGKTEATLSPRTLRSGGATVNTHQAFDVARKTLRSGGPTEAVRVTDALSKPVGEQALMLNITADCALGDGRSRVLAGYAIQRLRYRRRPFAGRSAESVGPVSDAETKAQNEIALLDRDATHARGDDRLSPDILRWPMAARSFARRAALQRIDSQNAIVSPTIAFTCESVAERVPDPSVRSRDNER